MLGLVLVVVLTGCGSSEKGATQPERPSAGSSSAGSSSAAPETPTDTSSAVPPDGTAASSAAARLPSDLRGLVWFAGRRARTGELLLAAERSPFAGRRDLLRAARAATVGAPADPDHRSLWGGGAPVAVRLWWDGDEGFYDVRLPDVRSTRRPPGTSMRAAHLAIQQVVWTLQSVGGTVAPVRFHVGPRGEPVTDLLGVPATGPGDTYLAADQSGVLGKVVVLDPPEGASVRGRVVVSGLAESFEATVGIRVVTTGGEVVLEDGTGAEQCCGRLWPWRYELDTTGWEPGTYVVEARTDDPVGIANGSDGPEVDTRTIVVE
ncbi:Immunoglobulin-like domain of spore germination [Nocardioides exalbidus]|uniref:Immunoglobulin-like domain of spore germination n=1 Tax=Nocardioides exalbidus TaxID=402596 RepID=A0A1H4XR26_9ACTN|nr:Gmad2 immunoglobulin-like domain-containing protein [Nocardioides exalbidus]SED07184.1 Immunoglobulin-like domain of spore germination [Nocardioides exalbidus]